METKQEQESRAIARIVEERDMLLDAMKRITLESNVDTKTLMIAFEALEQLQRA